MQVRYLGATLQVHKFIGSMLFTQTFFNHSQLFYHTWTSSTAVTGQQFGIDFLPKPERHLQTSCFFT